MSAPHILSNFEVHQIDVPQKITFFNSVGSKPKLGLAQFGFDLNFCAKKLGSASHAFQNAQLGPACHILQKSPVQLGLLYDLKIQLTLKNKKQADFQHFS